MNRGPRIAMIVGLIVVLGAIVFVSRPFTLSRGTISNVSGAPGTTVVKIPVRVRCRTAIVSAFEKKAPRFYLTSTTEIASDGDFDRSGTCQGPARRRLAGAGIVVLVATAGTLFSVRRLRSRDPSPTSLDERSTPARNWRTNSGRRHTD